MAYDNTFSPETLEKTIARLDNLRVDSTPDWGKMNAAQMLAHVNVAYDLAYGRKGAKAGPIQRFFLNLFVKPIVVGDKEYKQNSRTAPAFVVDDERDFDKEKQNLIDNLKDTVAKGEEFFDGRESTSFGKMTAREWSQQFQKHIEHHFKQFGI